MKPAEEEYILMGHGGIWRRSYYKDDIYEDFVEQHPFKLKQNVHQGIGNWHPEADPVRSLPHQYKPLLVECLANLWHIASKYGSKNLVYAGGVALNCVANSSLARYGIV